jgi:deoxyribodipyrimidine photolyase-related protein
LLLRLSQQFKENIMILIPILGDQLSLANPALRDVDPKDAVIVMAEVLEESTHVWSARMRSAVFLSAMRHFADALSAAGWHVQYLKLGEHSYPSLADTWRAALKHHQPKRVRCCEAGDARVEKALQTVCHEQGVELQWLDDDHFLMSRADFAHWAGKTKFLRMEMFYRVMRKKHQVLMQGDEPEGGQWNFDADNRESFGKKGPQDIQADDPYLPDAITLKVIEDLKKVLPDQPGSAEAFRWPVTRDQGLKALGAFISQRLSRFGPTQDAMWTDEPFLFHSLISVALNLKLIHPKEVIDAAVAHYRAGKADIASVEGFIRQVLGWREFIRGVYWLDMPDLAKANHFGYTRALPSWYWTGKTKMNCMQQSIGQTLKHGYAHHIQRLMITGNFALLAGVVPQEVSDWYLAVYVDAVEWVELPNVAGMALYANGGRFTTKPYIASGAYVKRMSNYCQGCQYDPGARIGDNACPMTTLYWAFLDRHQTELNRNPRAALMMKNHARIDAPQMQQINDHAQVLLNDLNRL